MLLRKHRDIHGRVCVCVCVCARARVCVCVIELGVYALLFPFSRQKSTPLQSYVMQMGVVSQYRCCNSPDWLPPLPTCG